MNQTKKSKKLLLVATTLMIIALTSVLSVYALVTLGTINGGAVTVGGVTSGTMYYNTAADGSGANTTTLQITSGSWYTKLILPGGYTGPVTIVWQLQVSTGPSSWADVSGATITTTGITLSGSMQEFFATTNGNIAGNLDWSTYALTQGTYRVTATINSAS